MDEEEDGGSSEGVRGDLEGRIPAQHKLLWGVLTHRERRHPSSTYWTAHTIKRTADNTHTYSYTDCKLGVSVSCSRTLQHAASDSNQPPSNYWTTCSTSWAADAGKTTGTTTLKLSAVLVEIYSHSEAIFNKPQTQNHKTGVCSHNTAENKCCNRLVLFFLVPSYSKIVFFLIYTTKHNIFFMNDKGRNCSLQIMHTLASW